MKNTVQKINNLTFGFQSQKGEQVSILKNISTSINQGETVGIVGESGSGKSTLAKEVEKKLFSKETSNYLSLNR